MKKLTETFNSIAVKKGDMFEVELKASSGGGYTWNVLVTSGKATLLAKDDLTDPSNPPDSIGGGHIVRFLFKADEVGMIELKATHKRAWEAAPLATKKLKVKVD